MSHLLLGLLRHARSLEWQGHPQDSHVEGGGRREGLFPTTRWTLSGVLASMCSILSLST